MLNPSLEVPAGCCSHRIWIKADLEIVVLNLDGATLTIPAVTVFPLTQVACQIRVYCVAHILRQLGLLGIVIEVAKIDI